jgi:DNA-binding response OmpR family regulator
MSDNKKILLVDDDIDILEQNKVQLEAKGFTVFTAENTEDGFELFKKEKPYAVVLDLMMEEYDSGFVLAHKIKKEEHGKNIPVFLVTAVTYVTGMKFDSLTEEEQEWIKTDAILNKPVAIDDLITKIEEYYTKQEN